MARSVKEWIGRSDDAKIPDRVRVRVFIRCGGFCRKCNHRISPGEGWDCDHQLALVNGGQHRESNLQVLCKLCHREKTAVDSAIKAKTYAIQKRHLGLKKSKGRPMPGSKASGWKRKMGGTLVRR